MKITAVEKRLLDCIQKNLFLLFAVVMSVLAVVVRIGLFDFTSRDYNIYLLPWYEKIRSLSGREALATAVGNYNIPYQTMIWILTLLPIKPLYAYKIISCICDFIMAAASGKLVFGLSAHLEYDKRMAAGIAAYCSLLFLPTVIMNSAQWAQCDAIFSAFILLALLFLYEDRFRAAFIMLGIAFAFKLQAVFILPFFLYRWAADRRFSLLNFLWLPAVQYILSIPAFLCGRSLADPITIYADQAGVYPYMYLNFQSFWVLVCPDDSYKILSGPAEMLTVVLLGCGLFRLLRIPSKQASSPTLFLPTAAWTAWTCVMFLPSMHERYGYLPEALLVISCCLQPALIPAAAAAVCCSLLHYGYYLFSYDISDELFFIASAVYFAAYVWFTVRLVQTSADRKSETSS
ncbi:MAG: hypothetical protein LKJ76_02295 [Lachnospiraceae bacterium]|jgi:Gpi18-like mannosyltransferase|nr:hypothetical protein [Lachnospiraceae bacterium]